MKNKNYISKGLLFFLYSFFLFGCDSKNEMKITELGSKIVNEGELHLSNQQVQLGHILIDTVKEQSLGSELYLTGVLTVNQNNMIVVSSRVIGRIEKLYFKNTGEEILRGQAIYDIYSEDINLALRELKLATEKKKVQKNISIDIDKMISSSRNKLILYGLSESQINDLQKSENLTEVITIKSNVEGIVSDINVKEGDYVMEGGSVIHVADYTSLWAEVGVFSEDIHKIKENMSTFVYFSDNHVQKVEGKVVFVNPELNASTKINNIKIEISNNKKILKPGMQVNVSILIDRFNSIALPTDAIILEEEGSIVWIQTGHNTYKNTMVQTGIESNGYTQILHGLKKGDLAIVSGNYLLQSEYTFKSGNSAMKEHNH